jgi:hypothetical protein
MSREEAQEDFSHKKAQKSQMIKNGRGAHSFVTFVPFCG